MSSRTILLWIVMIQPKENAYDHKKEFQVNKFMSFLRWKNISKIFKNGIYRSLYVERYKSHLRSWKKTQADLIV